MEDKLGLVDPELAFRVLEQMASHRPVAFVPFFRGESLLHPQAFDILRRAKELRVGPIQFTTNATLLDEAATTALLDLEIDFLSFSLDTVDPEIYERSRRGSRYEVVRRNILRLLEERSRRNLRAPEVQVSAVATSEHLPGLEAFVSFWKDKVDRVRIYEEHSTDGNPGSLNATVTPSDHRRPCHKVFTDLILYWDGRAACCNHDWNRGPDLSLGDARTQSIEEIWRGEGYRLLRTSHCKGDLRGAPPCERCDHWQMYYHSRGFVGRLFVDGAEVSPDGCAAI